MKALLDLKLDNLVFIDIETVRENETLDLSSSEFDAWKYQNQRNFPDATDVELQELYIDKAALYAEFAKIVCITVGRIDGNKLKMRSYNDADEKVMLEKFNDDLTKVTDAQPNTAFCAHAGIGFDIPFIFKRMMVHQVSPNELLETAFAKPWELAEQIIDTKDAWKGTAFAATSLMFIAHALGIPSPKDDISGADVGVVYYSGEEGAVERITRYCEKDVLTTANVVRRCRFEPLLEADFGVAPITELPLIQKLFDGGKYGALEKAKLINILGKMSPEERDAAFVVLEAGTSTARGKKTKFTKAHIKTLKALFNE